MPNGTIPQADGFCTCQSYQIAIRYSPVKLPLKYDQTFTVVAKGASSITISPRPIAADDSSLTDEQKVYANIATQLTAADELNWLNTVEDQSSVVMLDKSIILASNPIPFAHEMFQGLDAEAFSIGGINGMIGFESNLGRLNRRISYGYLVRLAGTEPVSLRYCTVWHDLVAFDR